MPQVCSVKVLMFLLDRYITHQTLYAVLDPEKVKMGKRGVSERFVRYGKVVVLIVVVPFEQYGWGRALTSAGNIFF